MCLFYFPVIDIRLIQVATPPPPPGHTASSCSHSKTLFFLVLIIFLTCRSIHFILLLFFFYLFILLFFLAPFLILDFIYFTFLRPYNKLLHVFLLFNVLVPVFIEYQGEELNKQCLHPVPSLNSLKNILYYVCK